MFRIIILYNPITCFSAWYELRTSGEDSTILTFEKVSSKISKISLLQINAGRGNMLEFRDIPITKK